MLMTRIDMRELLKLRVIALALGEAHHAGWWKSQFLSPTGLSFLERLYPHTNFEEAVRSATLAALELHDSNIGKGRVFHLFRLSQSIEREIDGLLKEGNPSFRSDNMNLLPSKDKLLDALKTIAGDMPNQDTVGPVLLNVRAEQMVQSLAAYYFHAFQQDKQIFPYFEEIL